MFKSNSVDQSTFVAETPLNQSLGSSLGSKASPPTAEHSQDGQLENTTGGGTSGENNSNPKEKDSGTARGSKKPFNLKIVLIASPILLVVVLFIAVQIRNSRGEQLPVNPVATPTIIQNQQVDRSPIQQRIDRLNEELGLAAPTQQEFAFPPVDSEISITSE